MSARPLIVVRPEPGNAATVAAARANGIDAISAPLFAVEPLTWLSPGAAPFDAVLLGSANAVRHAGPALVGYTALPAYAVGEATAAAAREAGFEVAASGETGLQELLPLLARDRRGRVLRLAGQRHVELDPPSGVEIVTEVVYWARPLPLDPALADRLRCGAVAMLHSADAARHFAEECTRLDLDRGGSALACLAPRVATAAGTGWAACRVAPRVDDAALLALAREMCETVG